MIEDRAYTILTALRNIKLSISDEMNEQLKPWFDDIEKAIEDEQREERMTNEQAIKWLKDYIQNTPFQMEQYERAFEMAIKALSQESEIEENIIKYMKKYPNHVGNTDFWEGFYACRNVVLQLDDEEYSPKEQEPCDDLISREDAFEIIASNDATDGTEPIFTGRQVVALLSTLPSVTQKCEKCAMNGSGSKYCDNCKQKSGKWITEEMGEGRKVYCSECKESADFEYVRDGDIYSSYGHGVVKKTKYCPNCGAKMESEVEE